MTDLALPRSDIGAAAAMAEGAAPAQYRVEVVDDIGPQWDAMVGCFADACLEQMAAYAVPRWGNARLCGVVLHDMATGELAAMALAVIATIPMFELGLAYVKFGPLWRRRGRAANPSVLTRALEAVRDVFAGERGLVVRLMPSADPDHAADWSHGLAASGFKLNERALDPERYFVDLRLSESEQMASLDPKWRANLKKALKEPLDIREVDFRAALPDFIALYQDMLARKHFVDHHNIKVLPAFAGAAASAPELGVRLFLADHAGRPVAGSIVVGNGDQPFVAFSASDERARSLRAGYALRWWNINRLRESNSRWLDLGGAEGDDGLRSFKLGNIGRRGQVVRMEGDYEIADNLLSAWVTAAMSGARKWLRDGAVPRLLARKPA
jgi:hypothetical protein